MYLILRHGCCLTPSKMNEDKTEVLLVTPKRVAKSEPLSEFMNINGTCVKVCPSLMNLGVTLDSTLSLHQHVLIICRSAFLELRRINSIRNSTSLGSPLSKPSPMVSAPLHIRVLPYGINYPWKSGIRAQLMS